MKAPLSYVPTLPAAVGVTVGILLYGHGAGVLAIAGAVLAFCVLYACRQHFAAFFFLFAALGITVSIAHEPDELPPGLFDGEHTAYGAVKSVRETTGSVNYTVVIDSIDGCSTAEIRCMTTVLSVADIAERGSYICFTADFTPLVTQTDLPYETDYAKNLRDAGYQCRCIVDAKDIAVINPPCGWDAIADKMRSAIYNAIVSSPVDGDTAAFLVAVILGDDGMLLPNVSDAFRSVGVAHILALSGMHVGIIATLLVFLLFPLQGSVRGHNIRSVITVILIWAYALIVGFTPSIVRASIMLSVFCAAWLIQRGYRPFNSLLLSIVIILFVNPLWLYTPGLQLSVCAVAAILAFCGSIPKSVRKRRWLYYMINIVGIPVSAMLGTAMVSIFYFGVFPFMFLFGNIVTGFLFPPILMGGTVLMLLKLCGIHFGFAGFCVSGLYHIMVYAIRWLAETDWCKADGIQIDPWVVLPYMMSIFFMILAFRRLASVRLWLLTLISIEFTLITFLLTDHPAPGAEMYITRTRPTRIVVGHNGHAWLWTDARDIRGEIAECNDRYSAFLKHRGYGGSFLSAADIENETFCAVTDRLMLVGDTSMSIVYDDTVSLAKGICTDYALICRGYKRSASEIVMATGADTLLLAPNVYPTVRRRIIEECADTIPYIDLSVTAFCRIW